MLGELTIDLDAVRRNVARLAALAAPARCAAVVKGNAYGHGLVAVARALDPDVAAFCVYRADEAATLRAAGVGSPILVLGPVAPRDLDLALDSRAAITLWDDGAYRRDVARAARARGERFAVHAKIDTGVTRLGIDVARAPAIVASYLADADLDVRGAYTHLAAAEELESAYTMGQLAAFERATAPVLPALHARGALRHAAASAAAMLYPPLRLDLVRAGIAIYGIWPSAETRLAVGDAIDLEPALSFASELVVVRDVEAGRSVGYGCTFETTRPSRIGIVPLGYAEGLPRALSNRGVALVGGTRVPFVGRVCMNMAFLDVTDVRDARAGSRVTFVGRDGDVALDANAFAERAGTIGYELVARLPADLPRRYVSAAIASASSSVPS
jgi:alanine racemase